VRLDGGWGVDALLGEQTRVHEDVDIVVGRGDAVEARARLERLSFRYDPEASPGLPARLVLRDGRGRHVDLHLIVRDAAGNGWQQLDDGTWGRYDADELDATGTIAGRSVPCIGAQLQLRHHRGYEWKDKDEADVNRLTDRFGFELR
jgi:lincosamide nucleotidyltransferase A/C/D/E